MGHNLFYCSKYNKYHCVLWPAYWWIQVDVIKPCVWTKQVLIKTDVCALITLAFHNNVFSQQAFLFVKCLIYTALLSSFFFLNKDPNQVLCPQSHPSHLILSICQYCVLIWYLYFPSVSSYQDQSSVYAWQKALQYIERKNTVKLLFPIGFVCVFIFLF